LVPALTILVLSSTLVAVGATKHTLLVVLTHADDNVSIAPLLAKYSAEGHAVYYAAFTGLQDPSGEDGSPARGEVLCASRVLGVRS
jgi:LmbE family N-acetylglucosaminyl deacetylase